MDISSKQYKDLIKEIARRNDVKPEIVHQVVLSEFETARINMKRADSYNDYFPYIKLPYLFTFKVYPGRRKVYVQKARKVIEDVYNQERESTD